MEPSAEPLHDQFAGFLQIRWQGILILATTSLIAGLAGGATWPDSWPSLLLLCVVLGSGVLFRWGMRTELLRQPKVLSALRWVLLGLDLVILTALCHFTGGIISLYVLMPLLYIVASAPLLGSRMAYAAAAWTTVLFGGMTALEVSGAMLPIRPLGPSQECWVAVYSDRPMIAAILLVTAGLFFLAAQMGSTLANRLARQRTEIARHYQEAQREARKMRLVNELSRSLSGILEWPTLLARVLTELEALFSYDYALLYLHDQESDRLRLIATRGFSDQEARACEATAMDRHPGWVLRNRQALLAPEAERDPRVRYPSAQRCAAALAIPLLYQERCLGVLEFGSVQKGSFSHEEQELLEGLAGQLAAALDNSRLYTEIRRALEELRGTQEQLARSSRMAAVGELIAGLAHELNNPLGIILGNVQLVLEDKLLSSAVRQNLKAVEAAAGRLARLMRVLTDLGALHEEPLETIDMQKLIEDALARVGERLEREGIAVERQYAPSLPPVWGSSGRLLQVLEQILLNAVEAMSGQEKARRITLSTRCEGEQVVLSVRDTGRGIPADQLARVFEPAFTTKIEEGRSRALGLGLYAAYYAVRAHSGDLRLTSHEGSGTELTIRLPALASQLR